jgi:ABC-type polar amino acid transport system ATPase subunit
MIRVRGLRKRFAGAGSETLSGVDFSLDRTGLAAILGVSGSGKSTLLRCIVGLERADAGTVELDGRAGLVFQSFELFPHLTALQNCALAPRLVDLRTRHEAEELARRHLVALGLSEKADSFPEMLSGGQRQRVAIARALAMEPALLLYDEPTSALDPSLRREVVETLRRVAALGMTQIVVTHDVSLARAADVVFVLDHGRIVEEGPPSRVLDAPLHESTRALLAHPPGVI